MTELFDRSTDGSLAELDSLTLTGLEIFAHHGVFDFERENGQTFIVDVTVWLDSRAAAAGDELAATLHYGELAEEIHRVAAADPVDLIETLAERIASTVLAHPVADRVRVTVHKPDAPIAVPFADVAITITRVAPAAEVTLDEPVNADNTVAAPESGDSR
jgi:dihydroneopterin aldolase